MTSVDNIATLMTIIFGLMLTDLFASVHRLIRNRKRVKWHWLPLLTTWYVLLTVLKNWWGLVFQEGDGLWDSGWIFLFYGHLLFLLYLVVSAVLPDEIPAEGLDLRKYYFETRRHFWGLLAGVNLTMLIFELTRTVATVHTVNWMVVASNIFMGVVVLTLAWSRRTGYHAVIVIMMVALTAFEMIVKL